MREFLRELSLKGWGDLNGMLATLNDGELCREALTYWLDKEWITIAPNSPLTALAGPAWSRQLTVHEFCGEEPEPDFAESTFDVPVSPPGEGEGEGESDEGQ